MLLAFLTSPFFWAGCIAAWFLYRYNKRCTLPGPWGIPIVGYLPFLTDEPYKKGMELSKTWGDVFQLSLGTRTVVMLNSASAIQEAYGHNAAFAGRPDVPSLRVFAESGTSRFTLRSGPQWKFLRKCATKSLSVFATSRNSRLEAVVNDGLEYLCKQLDANLGKPFKPGIELLKSVAGITGSIMFGFDFDPENPILNNLLDLANVISQFVAFGNRMDNLPFGKYIYWNKVQYFLSKIKHVDDLTTPFIKSHVYDGPDEDVRDVSDALTKIAEETAPGDLQKLNLTQPEVKYISQDLFGAGFNTTLESFIWLLNLTAAHPEVQRKVQQELEQKLGDRSMNLNDRGNLDYVEATMYEAFRIATLTPFGLPHGIMEDTEFRGYFIPKGCVVLANLYAVHRNEKVFPDPHTFKPERFLKNGKLDIDLGAKVMPFSTGKRRCVGENLARQEIALLYSNVMQRYNFDFAPGEWFDSTAVKPGFVRSPIRHSWIITKRK